MTNSKKTLLWLEDVPKTVGGQIIFAKRHFHVEVVSQLNTFANVLNNSAYDVKAIILDIMLYKVTDLKPLIGRSIETQDGYKAGWRILEYYLRSSGSDFKDIPVLILSVRELSDDDKRLLNQLQEKDDASIELIAKYGPSNSYEERWSKKFEGWIKKIAGGN